MEQIILPKEIEFALAQLTQAGFQGYIVGGCVRDALLNRTPNDWDVTTSALPDQILQIFSEYPTIIIGKSHGTIGVILAHKVIEITTFRTEGAYTDHRHPDSVSFTDRLVDDLARRDFTVNAMAYHPETGIIDPYGGQTDLKNKLIRAVRIPSQRFEEDGLRILRGLRFAAQLGFSIEKNTEDAIHQKKELLHLISKERVQAEFRKLMAAPYCAAILRNFSDLIFTILPELKPMYGFAQNTPYHRYDVWEHTLHAVDATPNDLCLRMTMLLHDCGKPHTYEEDETGIGHFPHHARISVELAEQILLRLRFEKKLTEQVLLLIRHHDIVLIPEEKWLRRQCSRFGIDTMRQLLIIHRSDALAQSKLCAKRLPIIETCEAMVNKIVAQAQTFQLKDLAVNGRDLQDWGIPKGKEIGDTLHSLLQAVMDEQCENTPEALKTFWEQSK